jgi:Protein of unknown function (DUF3152)
MRAAVRSVSLLLFVLATAGALAVVSLPFATAGVPGAADSADQSTARGFTTAPAEPVGSARAAPPGSDPELPTAADLEAGILRREIAESGSGEFDVAAGSEPAPGSGEVRTLRVEVERGLPVDRIRFADFVMRTLNDPRGWGHDGAMTFARTDGDAPVTVVLATPDTTARLCGDRGTRGLLSCRIGPHVVLTFQRWVDGTDEYAGNLTGYRRYLVNHEVGHALGHGHERCQGAGLPAPVMQQQTLGLDGCAPNSWPYPDPPAAT